MNWKNLKKKQGSDPKPQMPNGNLKLLNCCNTCQFASKTQYKSNLWNKTSPETKALMSKSLPPRKKKLSLTINSCKQAIQFTRHSLKESKNWSCSVNLDSDSQENAI